MTITLAQNEPFELKRDGKTVSLQVTENTNFATNAEVEEKISEVEEKIDIESSLVARSSTIQKKTGWTDNQSNGERLYFRPRFFGMENGDLLKDFVLRTKESSLTPFDTVYARMKRYSDNVVVGISKPVTYPNTINTDVTFTFEEPLVLVNNGNYYYIDFSETEDGAAISTFGIKLYVASSSNEDCYFGTSNTWVPVMTVHFYSWISGLSYPHNYKNGEFSSGTLQISPYSCNSYTAIAGTAVTEVTMSSASPSFGNPPPMREASLVVDCTGISSAGNLPSFAFGSQFRAANGDSSNMSLSAGVFCVFSIEEYVKDKFLVTRRTMAS